MTNCALIPYQALTPDHGPLGDNHYRSALIQEAERFLASRAVLPDNRFLLPLILWAAHTHCWEAWRLGSKRNRVFGEFLGKESNRLGVFHNLPSTTRIAR